MNDDGTGVRGQGKNGQKQEVGEGRVADRSGGQGRRGERAGRSGVGTRGSSRSEVEGRCRRGEGKGARGGGEVMGAGVWYVGAAQRGCSCRPGVHDACVYVYTGVRSAGASAEGSGVRGGCNWERLGAAGSGRGRRARVGAAVGAVETIKRKNSNGTAEWAMGPSSQLRSIAANCDY